MRHIAVSSLAAGLAALTLAGCDAPSRAVAPTGPVRLSAATTSHFEGTIEFPGFVITNPCDPASENINVSGRTHVTFQFVLNDNGIQVHDFQSSQSLQGVGETTGTRYEFILVEHFGIRQESDAATNITSQEVFKVVSQGGGDNFLAFTNMHTTINANGEPTAEVVVFRTECVG